MAFDPKNFLNFAKEMIDDLGHDEEARYRTAVSRAYYAAHLVCKKIFIEMKVKTFIEIKVEDEENMAIIHKMVIDHLLKINDPIGRMFKSLRRIRNKADYNMDWKFKRKGTKTIIQDAEFIINYVTTYKEGGLGT